jgi:hypothetical protein
MCSRCKRATCAGNESQIARRSFRVDTQPPVFVSIRTENLRPTSAQVVVVTDEPSTGRVEYRRSDASEWQQVALTPAQTTHRATLSNLGGRQRVCVPCGGA